MWLHESVYSVGGGYLHITGRYMAKIIGIEERYREGKWKEARLVYRGGDMYLYIAVEVPRPMPIKPEGIVAVDVSERYVHYGNSQWVKKVEAPVEKTVRLWSQAEELMRKYSAPRYTPWSRRGGIRERIRRLYKKARDVVEDWVRKMAVQNS